MSSILGRGRKHSSLSFSFVDFSLNLISVTENALQLSSTFVSTFNGKNLGSKMLLFSCDGSWPTSCSIKCDIDSHSEPSLLMPSAMRYLPFLNPRSLRLRLTS